MPEAGCGNTRALIDRYKHTSILPEGEIAVIEPGV